MRFKTVYILFEHCQEAYKEKCKKEPNIVFWDIFTVALSNHSATNQCPFSRSFIANHSMKWVYEMMAVSIPLWLLQLVAVVVCLIPDVILEVARTHERGLANWAHRLRLLLGVPTSASSVLPAFSRDADGSVTSLPCASAASGTVWRALKARLVQWRVIVSRVRRRLRHSPVSFSDTRWCVSVETVPCLQVPAEMRLIPRLLFVVAQKTISAGHVWSWCVTALVMEDSLENSSVAEVSISVTHKSHEKPVTEASVPFGQHPSCELLLQQHSQTQLRVSDRGWNLRINSLA